MAKLEQIKAILEANKPRLKAQYDLLSIGIFGSYTRNEQSEGSDIDIVVEFKESPGIQFIDLAEELEQLLGCKVDLVSRKGIKPRYWNAISEEIVYV